MNNNNSQETCILFCPTDTWGGVEKNVRLRAIYLGEKGYQVVVVLLKNKFSENFKGFKNLEVISVNQRGGDINLFVVKRYTEIIKKYKPKVVFSALKKDWFLVSLAAHLCKVPRIVLYLGIKRNIRNALKYRTVFKLLNAKVLVNSYSLKNHLINSNSFFTNKNVFRIYNGFDIPTKHIKAINFKEILELPDDTFIIGCAGRFSEQKGFDLFPQILSELPKNIHIVHAGGDGSENEIQKRLLENKFSDRIHFMGYQKDIIPFMKGIDMFLLPSRWEGMANVLNEVMSVGKKIVSTRVSGSEELLENGKHGQICEIEDVDCIIESVLKIYNNKTKHEPYKQIERIEKSFSIDQMISQTEHLFFKNLDSFKENK